MGGTPERGRVEIAGPAGGVPVKSSVQVWFLNLRPGDGRRGGPSRQQGAQGFRIRTSYVRDKKIRLYGNERWNSGYRWGAPLAFSVTPLSPQMAEFHLTQTGSSLSA